MWGRRLATLAIAAWALMGAAAAQAAQTHTVSFDDRPPGTATTAAPGVTFIDAPTVFDPVRVPTFSEPHALHAAAPCTADVCANGAHRLRMTFDPPVTSVSLYAGLDDQHSDTEFGTYARLVAYRVPADRATNPPAAADFVSETGDVLLGVGGAYRPITTRMAVAAPGNQQVIRSAVLYVGEGTVQSDTGAPRRVNVDHVQFTTPAPGDPPPTEAPPEQPRRPPPTIRITAPLPGPDRISRPEDSRVAGQVNAPGGLRRFCITPGRAATFPTDCARTDLVDPTGAFDVSPVPGLRIGTNEVTAWAEDDEGRQASASVRIQLADPRQVDLRVVSMQVSQAVQGELPAPDPADQNLPVRYQGVDLSEGRTTVVRVFANAASTGFPGRRVPRVPMVLYGFREGDGGRLTPLRGPGTSGGRLGLRFLLPDNGTRDLPAGSGAPGELSRTWRLPGGGFRVAPLHDPEAAYVFTLPADWTRGRLRLIAEVNPSSVPPVVPECAEPVCASNNRMVLSSIPFYRLNDAPLAPVELYTRDAAGAREAVGDVEDIFSEVRALHPLGDRMTIAPWQGDGIDITPIMRCNEADRAARACHPEVNRRSQIFDRLAEWDDRTDQRGHAIGVQRALDSSVAPPRGPLLVVNAAIVYAPRERTAVAHEVFHTLGFWHASGACGGGVEISAGGLSNIDTPTEVAVPWEDGRGGILGQGIDTRRRPYPLKPRAGPTGLPSPSFYDVMSYCADEDTGWISTRNWNDALGRVRAGIRTHRATSRRTGGPTLRVSLAIEPDGRATLLRIQPGSGRPTPPAHDAMYRVIVRDAGGGVVSDTPVASYAIHSEPAAEQGLLLAEVPSAGAASLEVLRRGERVAALVASPSPPTVTVPTPRAVGGAGVTTLRWSRSDPDGPSGLLSAVEVSPDGGRTWRTLGVGIAGTSLEVRSTRIPRSTRARLRVRVNDGFHEAAATSGRFVAAGARPEVAIHTPAAGSRVRRDATLALSGTATDDHGRPLGDRALRWYDGRRPLGRGRRITVTGLPPGRRTLRLQARDGRGRIEEARVRLRVEGVAPSIVGFRAPKRLGRAARRVTLHLASSLPGATLTVAGRRHALGTRVRPITAPVRRGSTPLRLRLVLRAGGTTTRTTITIPRG